MRRTLAMACGALLAFSAPAFSQSSVATSPTTSQPAGQSVVNYQNGLDALGQAPPDQNSGPGGIGSTGLLVGAGILGAAGLTIGLIAANQNKSSTTPSVSP